MPNLTMYAIRHHPTRRYLPTTGRTTSYLAANVDFTPLREESPRLFDNPHHAKLAMIYWLRENQADEELLEEVGVVPVTVTFP